MYLELEVNLKYEDLEFLQTCSHSMYSDDDYLFIFYVRLGQTVLLKNGPPQYDIHYWLGNDANKVGYGFH